MLGALALALAACSSGAGGGEAASEGVSQPPIENESPQPSVVVEALDTSAFGGDGEVASIRRLHSVDDSVYAAGTVQSLADAHRRPLLLERRGSDWTEVTLTVAGDAPAVVEEVVVIDGAAVAFGSAVTGEDEDVVAWALDAPGELLELTGSLVGPGAQTVTAASAGPAGVLVAGNRDGDHVVWYSTDGRAFEELPIHDTLPEGDEVVSIADVAVSGDRGLVALQGVDHSVILTVGGDGQLGELVAGTAGEVVVTAIAAAPSGFVVGGGSGEPGAPEPMVWRTDGQTWPDGEKLPVTDSAGTTNRGYEIADLDLGSGRIVASIGFAVWQSSLDGDATWTEVPHDGLTPSMRPDDIAVGPAGQAAELVVDGREIYRSDGTTWQQLSGLPLAEPAAVVDVDAITHRDGLWVVAGGVLDADGTRAARVWWSDDGRRWQDASVPDNRDVFIRSVGLTGDGFALVGAHEFEDRAVVWTSPDARSWTTVTSPLLQTESGGVLQIESVLARPEGALLAGYGFDGQAISPYVLRLEGTSITEVDVPALEGVQDSVTVGLCEDDGAAIVTGVGQDDIAHIAWWEETDAGWHARPTAHAGGLWTCANVGDRVLGLAGIRPTAAAVLPLTECASPARTRSSSPSAARPSSTSSATTRPSPSRCWRGDGWAPGPAAALPRRRRRQELLPEARARRTRRRG
jgi:hypothetical protein